MFNLTGVNSIDSLFHSSWAGYTLTPISLTYSFLTVAPGGNVKDSVGFAPMSAAQQEAVKAAMAAWSAVANITFTQVSAGGDVQIGTNDQGTDSAAYASYPNGKPTLLFMNNKASSSTHFADGDYGREVLLHELGHTLGLKHPGDYADDGSTNHEGPFLPDATDNRDYTVMSYNNSESHDLHGNYDITPMLYDIQVMQVLYGTNTTYHTGADTYRFIQDSAEQCIWDAGGTDTLDFSQCTAPTVINLREGGFSSTAPGYYNISIAYGVTIERAIAGSGGSIIFGNDAGNVITGSARHDDITLGKGSDTVNGGGGSDTVDFTNALASYTIDGPGAALTVKGEGTDLLNNIAVLEFKDVTIQLSNYIDIKGGGDGNDVFRAGTGSELFTGGSGSDTVEYSRERANFTISADGGAFEIKDKGGSGGTDLVAGVERLKFSDGSGVALDIGGAAGQAYRIYQAAFNRTPDLGGLGYWLDKMDHGLSLVSMARFFLDSAESVATYGVVTDTEFVTQLYANVLHRQPDAGGLAFYLTNFAAGNYTRESMLADFSESPENQANIIGSISNGINYTVY